MDIKEILDNNKNKIVNANYQFDKILEILGEEEIELDVNDVNDIYNWMDENDLLGKISAYLELMELKTDIIKTRLKQELENYEQRVHANFYNRNWTDYQRMVFTLQLGIMARIYNVLDQLSNEEIINVCEDEKFSMERIAAVLMINDETYNISDMDIKNYIKYTLEKDIKEPMKKYIISEYKRINDKPNYVYANIHEGCDSDHAVSLYKEQRKNHSKEIKGDVIVIKNLDGEVLYQEFL
jgi:hypothetical protein